ncbi:di/tricarboxylate transporter [Sinobaca qinghaiensis]|uniref:Di/tricarboxylate transporter n=1 Tax=Sinobaca qinghaiensis TaxID=342944 RepID=A0A419V933_9BACL|nr:SLC13 family permease [Sinobaca qinghaiensis]RKD76488.1 di/tricarboxylate transporter [Sinobaca qinghaiensis]
MTWEIIALGLIIVVMMGALIKELAPPEIILLLALGVLVVSGILSFSDALTGFTNQGMLTVGLLCIVAGSVQRSGLVETFINRILSKGETQRQSLLRILIPSSILSGFLNNTPIVATFSPLVRQWCERHNVSPSKFLLPLSYATITGGTMTLIGTSTNLVVHGMLVERGYDGFSFFQLSIIGVPITIGLIIFIVLLGPVLLPDRTPPSYLLKDDRKRFMMEFVVGNTEAYHLKTIRSSGLWTEKSIEIKDIYRKQKRQLHWDEKFILQEGDRLWVKGTLDALAAMERKEGIEHHSSGQYGINKLRDGENKLLEVVVTHYSSLLFQTIGSVSFTDRFDAEVAGVHRHQDVQESSLNDIPVKPGDTLLLLAGPQFEEKTLHHNEFTVLTKKENPFFHLPSWKAVLPVVLMSAMVVLSALQIVPIFYASLAVTGLLLLLRVMTVKEAVDYIPIPILLVIAAAFGVGEAMLQTGAAAFGAGQLINWVQPFGIIGIFIVIYIVTNLFTEMITNNAAAIIMLPISIEAAGLLDIDILPLAVIVAIAASASFITPIGYQTNLFVYHQAGYRFTDFMRLGIPVSFFVMLITVTITWIVWV